MHIISDPEDWSNEFTHRFISAWISKRERFFWLIAWQLRNYPNGEHNLTSSDILREMRLYMPRKKGNSDNAKPNNSGGSGGYDSQRRLQWVNIKLTDEDVDALDRSDATMEYLSAYILDLASLAISISIRCVDGGKSYSCSLIRAVSDSADTAYGLSGFGSTLRDAFLVTVYKYEHYLDADFDNAGKLAQNPKQSRRFG